MINPVIIFVIIIILYLHISPIKSEIAPENREYPTGGISDEMLSVLNVAHYDCEDIQESVWYAANQVDQCRIKPENMRVAPVIVTVYQRSYRVAPDVNMCQLQYSVNSWYCGEWSHTSMSAKQISMTRDYPLTAKQCTEAVKTKKFKGIKIGNNKMADIAVENNVKGASFQNTGQSLVSKNDCSGRGWIYHYSFESFMQKITLNFDFITGNVYSLNGAPLPCEIEEGGCATTSLDPFAYTWGDIPENCLITKLRTQEARMIESDNSIFIISNTTTSTGTSEFQENVDFRLKYNEQTTSTCGKSNLFETEVANIFIQVEGGFKLDGSKSLPDHQQGINYKQTVTNEYMKPMSTSSFAVQYDPNDYPGFAVQVDPEDDSHQTAERIARTSLADEYTIEYANKDKLTGRARNSANYDHKVTGGDNWKNPWDQYSPTQIVDYEVQTTVKLTYLFHFQTEQLRTSELALLKRMCDLERTQLLTIMTLAQTNSKLAGFLLTKDRSKFLEARGSSLYLYQCSKQISPLKLMEKCYDRIPISYKEKTYFVDPINRQTLSFATEVPCATDGDKSNAIQLDIDIKHDGWYNLVPQPIPLTPPNFFHPQEINRVTKFWTYNPNNAGLYTKKQITKFWNTALNSRFEDKALQEFSHEFGDQLNPESQNNDPGGIFNSMNQQTRRFHIDSLISADWFKNMFIGTFGEITYYIEKCGIFFACFLFVKLVLTVIFKVLRTLEITRMIGGTIGFSTILAHSFFSVFQTAVTTSIVDKHEKRKAGTRVEFVEVDDPNDPRPPPKNFNHGGNFQQPMFQQQMQCAPNYFYPNAPNAFQQYPNVPIVQQPYNEFQTTKSPNHRTTYSKSSKKTSQNPDRVAPIAPAQAPELIYEDEPLPGYTESDPNYQESRA